MKNSTKTVFFQELKKCLSLGPKFSLVPVNNVNFENSSLLGDLENILLPFENCYKDIFGSKYTNIITTFLHKDFCNYHLNYYYNKGKKFLKQHPNILIVHRNGGNVSVAREKDICIQECQELLNVNKHYSSLTRNPISTLQQKANKIVSTIERDNLISDVTAKRLKNYNSAPRFYALSKIHKPTFSVKPKNLLNLLLLSKLLHITLIMNIKLKIFFFSNYEVVSFDVVSLFTNLPLDVIFNGISKHWPEIALHST